MRAARAELLALGALALAGVGLWWRGYRAGRRNAKVLDAAGAAKRSLAENDAEVRRILTSR